MKITPIKYSIHSDNVSPVFGEGVVHVEIVDEGAGEYLRLASLETGLCEGVVELEFEQVLKIAEIVKQKREI